MESLSFKQSKLLLAKYKIPLCPSQLTASKKEAAVFASSVGYPVVLKISSKEVLHKTDLGLVRTGIRDENELKSSWDGLAKMAKGIKTEGILVQKQIHGVETVAGMKRDLQFGPVLMFGLGGILVEVLKDVSFRIAPVNRADAMAMFKEIKGYKLLEGFRSFKPVDLGKLSAVAVSLSKLALENEDIVEADLNPVIANEKGAWIVDPRFLISK